MIQAIVPSDLPFNSIRFFKTRSMNPLHRVYSIVKYKPNLGNPTYLDTMFYSLPIRYKDGGMQNSMLAFTCIRQAEEYCKAINSTDIWRNHGEPQDACTVKDVTLSDFSFFSYNLNVQLVVVHNSYCEWSQREPFFEVFIADKCL